MVVSLNDCHFYTNFYTVSKYFIKVIDVARHRFMLNLMLKRSIFFTFQILKEFIKAKIKKSEAEDKTDLVSSVSIAYIIYEHSVYTNLDPEDYKRLFFSLILRPDPEEQTCIAFESLLDRIPCEQWQ